MTNCRSFPGTPRYERGVVRAAQDRVDAEGPEGHRRGHQPDQLGPRLRREGREESRQGSPCPSPCPQARPEDHSFFSHMTNSPVAAGKFSDGSKGISLAQHSSVYFFAGGHDSQPFATPKIPALGRRGPGAEQDHPCRQWIPSSPRRESATILNCRGHPVRGRRGAAGAAWWRLGSSPGAQVRAVRSAMPSVTGTAVFSDLVFRASAVWRPLSGRRAARSVRGLTTFSHPRCSNP